MQFFYKILKLNSVLMITTMSADEQM